MAALRLARRCGVAVATAVAVPVLAPSVVLAAKGEGGGDAGAACSRMVRPSDLPIYEEPEEVLDFEYHGRARSGLEDGVGAVRKEVEGVLESTKAARERMVHVYETGKAHSMATVDYITDEENILPRAGAITIGGLAGLVIGARRKGGLVKKVLYTSTGVITAASLCYPRQAYQISQHVYTGAKDYATIGYNFVVGVKPQSKVSPATQQDLISTPSLPAEEVVPPAPTPSEPEGSEEGATVKEEGKDIIIQLTPPQPEEKDYGQSNPEDSDMYTTRS